ncbi:hypothetical protein M422DRAFT_784937 [Sphaerobolus stellatus SS14]|uniref:Homeobox domain-containing protein n=1 Tax=Sphaerobolus stellatus (strain SS14) TaxID=990650 RepID=A0A0C9UPM6_SPHS4|nr:hypothetical protein M422DRAFT_784937 [Sphaerobolus stellatus SS14]
MKASLQPPRYPSVLQGHRDTPALLEPSDISSNVLDKQKRSSRRSKTSSNHKPISTIARLCYPFFLEHLDYPYPTNDEKENIVKKANNPDISISSVSDWFINARRRWGWVDICNRYFNGDAKLTSDTCARVLNRPIPDPTIDPVLRGEILDMKERLQAWHDGKTQVSDWAVALCELLESFTLEEKTLIEMAYTELSHPNNPPKSRKATAASKRKGLTDTPQTPQYELHPDGDDLGEHSELASDVSSLYGSYDLDDSQLESFGTVSLAGEKRKQPELEDDEEPLWSFPGFGYRQMSDASSITSTIGRTPSLTWSEFDEERPYKRNRSESFSSLGEFTNESALGLTTSTPQTTLCNPAYSFTFTSSIQPIEASPKLKFGFNSNTIDIPSALVEAGKKRSHEECEESVQNEEEPKTKRPCTSEDHVTITTAEHIDWTAFADLAGFLQQEGQANSSSSSEWQFDFTTSNPLPMAEVVAPEGETLEVDFYNQWTTETSGDDSVMCLDSEALLKLFEITEPEVPGQVLQMTEQIPEDPATTSQFIPLDPVSPASFGETAGEPITPSDVQAPIIEIAQPSDFGDEEESMPARPAFTAWPVDLSAWLVTPPQDQSSIETESVQDSAGVSMYIKQENVKRSQQLASSPSGILPSSFDVVNTSPLRTLEQKALILEKKLALERELLDLERQLQSSS